MNKNYIIYKVNINKFKSLYYNFEYRSSIEIFTIKQYEIYQRKYRENANKLSDNDCEYELGEVKNPHDKIFRKALNKKENVIEIINEFLEKGDKITEEEIEKYNSSYILDKLKNSEADVVYKIKNKDVFFLIEHQTKVDYSMPYRILKYELAIIDSVIIDEKGRYKNKEYKYPIIIPIVLYTGENKWNAELDLRKVQLGWKRYNGLELSKYNVYDINDIGDEKLLKEKPIVNKLMLMEKSKTEIEFIQNLKKISREFNNGNKKYADEEIKFFIMSVKAILKKQFDKQKIKVILEEMEREGEGSMMQVIEMLNRERAKLREDSKREGKIEDIKNMLKEKLPMDLISRITGMTENEIRKIK